jgi:glycosyltransferase involved in cell wall biosynthesis
MRLLITTDTVGGVWTFTKELVRGLLNHGNAVALVSFGRMPSPTQQNVCDLYSEQWPDRFLYVPSDAPLEWMANNNQAFTEPALLLAELAREFGAELLHSNQFCFGALDDSIPRIVTAHSDVLSWARFCRTEPLGDSPWLQEYNLLVQRGLRGADMVVAPTQWMMQELSRSFPLPDMKAVIENGRSVAVTSDCKPTLQAVTAGRIWDEAKDVSLLKDVKSPFPLLVAGDTRHELAGAPETLGEVQLLGVLSEEKLLVLFRQSALYICTSRYEPFGLAPLEAALCGCAVLARDIPPLREVWQDAAVYFSDPASLSFLLRQLSNDPQLLQDLRHRSMQRAEQFTRERMTENYLRAYLTILKLKKERAFAA